ncbi:MAG: glycosyltransferase, partial [Odoribacter sp.]|nr:glycosyltransferase [Odoribacter sp.]
MNNILFVNNSEINPVNSGIQRITAILAKAFTAQGWNCYGAYFEKSQASENSLFLQKLKLDFTDESVRQLNAFIRAYDIKRIIVQECWPLKKLAIVRQALISHTDCQLFYCLHNKPGKEFVPPVLSTECFRLFHGSNKLQSLKKSLVALLPSPIYKHIVQRNVRHNYSYIHRTADKIVLLSASYIPDFLKLAGLKETETTKFIAIGNCLSFSEEIQPSPDKQKEVLIVGRLSDRQKRISTALKIWQSIEQSRCFQDWRLKIVGNGPDEPFYRHLVRKLRLQQVDFEGKQNPIPYYQQASIFLMTSSYEGFPMVLTEAQQLGA